MSAGDLKEECSGKTSAEGSLAQGRLAAPGEQEDHGAEVKGRELGGAGECGRMRGWASSCSGEKAFTQRDGRPGKASSRSRKNCVCLRSIAEAAGLRADSREEWERLRPRSRASAWAKTVAVQMMRSSKVVDVPATWGQQDLLTDVECAKRRARVLA